MEPGSQFGSFQRTRAIGPDDHVLSHVEFRLIIYLKFVILKCPFLTVFNPLCIHQLVFQIIIEKHNSGRYISCLSASCFSNIDRCCNFCCILRNQVKHQYSTQVDDCLISVLVVVAIAKINYLNFEVLSGFIRKQTKEMICFYS